MMSRGERMGNSEQVEHGRNDERIVMPHKGGRTWLAILGVVLAIIIVVAAAFASGVLSFGKKKEAVTLTGAGATFPMPLILKWADEYYNATGHSVKINYGGGGSGAGITQIEGNHVDFAGSDAPLSATDSSTYGLLHLPETIGPVVVAYNEPSVVNLKLDGPTLAKIFMKNITVWNDPAISLLNPGTALPTDQITTVVRSDSSGTTFTFSGYLAVVSPQFQALYGQGKSVSWKQAIGASGNPGVAQTVLTTQHSIGYIELSYAKSNNIQFALLKNHDGTFITASSETASAAAASGSASLPAGDGDWSHVSILDAPGATSYPITTFTYILVYKELYNDQSRMNKTAAKALVDFLWWAVHDKGQSFSSGLYYAPLPASVVSLDEATLNSITYDGVALR
jgi:phosphate transport system substrate-binding protein